MSIKTKLLIVTTHAILVMGSNAMAGAVFSNGGFESADLSSWSVSSRDSATPSYVAQTAGTTTVASTSNGGLSAVLTTAPSIDSNTGINQTYDGSYAARVGDQLAWGFSGGGNFYNQITQTASVVAEADGSAGRLFFAWAAVEEISNHGGSATPFFSVNVLNLRTGLNIYDVAHYEDDGGAWVDNGNGWKYSANSNALDPKGWNVNNLDLTALGVLVGDNLQLTAIARDCSPTAHAMYVYLDGFGATKPISNVPEPTTIALMGLGLLGFAARRRNKA
jgi:hypothetical protein